LHFALRKEGEKMKNKRKGGNSNTPYFSAVVVPLLLLVLNSALHFLRPFFLISLAFLVVYCIATQFFLSPFCFSVS